MAFSDTLNTVLGWFGLQRLQDAQQFKPPVVVNQREELGETSFNATRRNVDLLRAAADHINIIRAAINAKKRHVTALLYTVSGPDDDVAADLEQFLSHPVPGMTWRQWLSRILEDLLVLDAGAVYVWRTRGGDLYGLLPIDGGTIRPVTPGVIPQPPYPAYEQWVAGRQLAALTTDELLYSMMNPRNHTWYGLSPTEAVLHTASIALRRMDGFADELDDSNMPAFFGETPEGWQPNQIEEWQTYWDAMTKNKPHRGVWGPANARVAFPPKVQVDTAFDLWLTQLILAVFEVQPQELGLTADVNRATGDSQEVITQRRSVRPLAMQVKEMIDQAFTVTGYEGYVLSFPELDERSRDEIRNDATAFIPLGVLTPNEVRAELGLEPLPDGDMPLPESQTDADPELARSLTRARPKTNFDITVPGPDETPVLLTLQDALKSTFIDASKRVRLEEILDQVREILDAGETISKTLMKQIAKLIGDAHTEELQSIVPLLIDMAELGAEVAAAAFTQTVNIELDWSLANAAAAEWARGYGYELIKGLGKTTRDRIGTEMGKWVEAQADFPDLVQRLNAILLDVRRANLVAATEATRVYAEGNRASWMLAESELNVEFVQVWKTAKDDLVCPVCGGLDGKTAPLDGEFPGGYKAPPAHPGCRCWLTVRVSFATERIQRLRTLHTHQWVLARLLAGGLRVTDYSRIEAA